MMSIEELKVLQSNIIRKNRNMSLAGLLVIAILLGVSGFILYSNRMRLVFALVMLFIELFFSTLILTIVKHFVNAKDIELFNREFKRIFVLRALQKYFDDVKYIPEKGFSREFIKEFGMLYRGDRMDSNDYISGLYKNIRFEQSDLHIEEKHEEKDKDGNIREEWETIFRGRLMVFDFNKTFESSMRVTSIFSAESLPAGKKFHRVRLEDAEFNQRFTVYAENEHDAFYILTPHFMQKMKDIQRELNCGVMFAFADSRMYAAVDNHKDSFEHNVFEPINEQETEEEISRDIRLITGFVDELNLDNRLFVKEE